MTPHTKLERNMEKKMNKCSTSAYTSPSERHIEDEGHEEFEETPTWAAVITVLGYALLSALGWLRDFLRHVGLEKKKTAHDPNPKVCLFLSDNT